MKLSFNTISRQLFLALGVLVTGILVIYIVSLSFISKLSAVHHTETGVNRYRIIVLQLIRNDQDYCRFETINDKYFETHRSTFLTAHDSLIALASNQLNDLSHDFTAAGMTIPLELSEVRTTTKAYCSIFDSLQSNVEKRGFRDFGLEGKMRFYAHALEDEQVIELSDLLMLRRHEKDFLLRRDDKYIRSFNALSSKLMQRKYPRSTIARLKTYVELFNELTYMQKKIGNSNKDGFMQAMSLKTEELLKALANLEEKSRAEAEDTILHAGFLFSCIAVTTTIVCLVLIYVTSVRITRPIKKLSGYMIKMMESEGLNERDIEPHEINEIKNLSQSFIRLLKMVRKQLSEIRGQSDLLTSQNLELKKVNDELDKFIYSAAHDLKSPLTSLDGLIRLAERDIDNPKYAEYFGRMHDAIQRLYDFIRNITDYARNKRQSLEVEEIQIASMINGIVDALRYLPHGEKLNIDIVSNADVIFCDRTRLDIVLKNVISNAFHYLDVKKHYSYLKIRIEKRAEFIHIVITDNGVGIRRESLPMIFDMFYRAVESSKGTGIGLYLVKEAMKSMGGRITVKSILGQWTSFEIMLPEILPAVAEPRDTIVVEELV
jgi:signal transduction histidine kinase